MVNPESQPSPSPEDPSAFAEDPVLDALLAEVCGGSTPPDLTERIIRQLRDSAGGPVPTPPPVVSASRPVTSPDFRPVAWAVGFAALAASVLVTLSIFTGPQEATVADSAGPETSTTDDPERLVAEELFTQATQPSALRPSTSPDSGAGDSGKSLGTTAPRSPGGAPDVPPQRSRSLAGGSPTDEPADVDSGMPETARSLAIRHPHRPPAERLTTVRDDVESTLVSYWNAIGARPTPNRADEAVAKDLSRRLGIRLDATALRDVNRLRDRLRQPAPARKLAEQFLEHFSGRGFRWMNEDDRKRLVDAFADGFRGQAAADVVISELLSGQRDASKLLYQSLGAGGRHELVQRLASVTMNQDIRCLRCHDAFIETRGTQSDYWAFASMVRRGLQRDEVSGNWKLARQSSGASGDSGNVATVFYEAFDGRSVMADPGLPVAWLSASQVSQTDGRAVDERIDIRLTAWAESLRSSPALAEAVVNLLWKMVHDRPIDGSVVDVNSPPHDAALLALQNRLVSDLLAHHFDLSRTLALAIASPVTMRSIPDSLSVRNRLVADEEDLAAYAAFAASKPYYVPWSPQRRLQTILATSGAVLTFDDEGQALLAQPLGDASPGTSTKRSTSPQEQRERIETRDFPIGQTSYPVAWLSSIDNPESRLAHVCYLAGRAEVPPNVKQAEAAMADADVAEPLRLSRIWWMIAP